MKDGRTDEEAKKGERMEEGKWGLQRMDKKRREGKLVAKNRST